MPQLHIVALRETENEKRYNGDVYGKQVLGEKSNTINKFFERRGRKRRCVGRAKEGD